MSEYTDEDDNDKARAAIVQRYRCGPEGPIEDWEDASFIVYKITDRYGFLHKNPLPHYQRDERLLQSERERAKKWIKMFNNWKAYYSVDRPSDKLRRRVYKGIPDSLRGEAWKKILNLDQIVKSGEYEKFRSIALEKSPDIRQIDLDVNRTYRDHIMFRDRFSVKQQALFNVLAAYSMYNTDVGYCQGMSGIAALMLMYMNEEDAFWALSELLTDRKHAMHGLFVPGFPKLLRFQSHHDKILHKQIPRIAKHLEKEGVYTSLYTLKWFMQCFLDRLPFSLVLRIYDIFMLDGDKILSAMAFHIIKVFKKQILKMDLEGIAPLLQEEIPNIHFNDDEVIDALQETMIELKKSKLDLAPPPGINELPTKPPGTLPDRNSFITASKRARMSKDRRSTLEVPMGRPPSPDLNATHSSGSLKSSSPGALEYNGIKFQQPKPSIIPPPKTPTVTHSRQPLPSYSEFFEQQLYDSEVTSRNSHPKHNDRRISKDRSNPKGHAKQDSDTKFHADEDLLDTHSRVRLPSGSSVGKMTMSMQEQSWSTELYVGHNVFNPSTSSYEEDYSRKDTNIHDNRSVTNGFVRPLTPPRDYENDFDQYDIEVRTSENVPHRKGTTHKVISSVSDTKFSVHDKQYATETRL